MSCFLWAVVQISFQDSMPLFLLPSICDTQECVWDLGVVCITAQFSEILLCSFWVCAAHAQLGGEPRICVSSYTELEGFLFPILFSLGFSPHSLAPKIPLFQFLWPEKWIFLRLLALPPPPHCLTILCHWSHPQGEAARKKIMGFPPTLFTHRDSFFRFH